MPATGELLDGEPLFEGPGLLRWVLQVDRAQVMWLRYVLEASEGVGFVTGGRDGVVHLIAPESQARGVETLLRDLVGETAGLRVLRRPVTPQAALV